MLKQLELARSKAARIVSARVRKIVKLAEKYELMRLEIKKEQKLIWDAESAETAAEKALESWKKINS